MRYPAARVGESEILMPKPRQTRRVVRDNHALPRSSGVYRILCMATGQIYVGSAVNLRERWSEHRAKLLRSKHHNAPLQRAWTHYGEESFEFSILELVEAARLIEVEQT